MKKKIFVTGSAGLVGSRFVELNRGKYDLFTPEIDELDLTNLEAAKDFLAKEKPAVIVHFAAFTDVGGAEKNQRGDRDGLCWKVNVEATENLVSSIDPEKTHFIQISTDMVFSGSKEDPGPYTEDHPIEIDSDKLTWYGWTKNQAEKRVKDVLKDKATIVRINYPVRAHFASKSDFLRAPLKLFDEGKLYPLFTDQQFSITFIDGLHIVLEKVIDEKVFGVYHVSSVDTTTPNELVSYMLQKVRGYKGKYKGSSLAEYKKVNSAAYWPLYAGLDTKNTQEVLGIEFKSWREIVDELVKQGLGK